MKNNTNLTVSIIGGAGHIGLPLGLLLKNKRVNVTLIDINKKNIDKIKNKKMPFYEQGAQLLLDKGIKITDNLKSIKNSKIIIVCIGTPVDEYFNPKLDSFFKVIKEIKKYISSKQTVIIRSSVYPQTCKKIVEILHKNVSYCPERIVQGKAIEEMHKLPQIVSGFSKKAIGDSKKIFNLISKEIIVSDVLEAELIKLFSNSWRYVNFAISNQFYMICAQFGIDYNLLRKKMTHGYDRNKSIPSAGFTAGPCLLKDTMQLTAFTQNQFSLGHNAMLINEGIPNFIVNILKKDKNINKKNIGILGLTFKPDIDDIRDSLSFKLIKLFNFNGYKYFVSDEFFKHEDNISKEKLIKKSDIIILAVPHSNYNKCIIPKTKKIIDIWGFFDK